MKLRTAIQTTTFFIYTLVALAVAQADPAATAAAIPTMSTVIAPTNDKSFYEHLLLRLEAYKPTYLVVNASNVKGQFSFKAPIFSDFGLYMGYSQLLIWNIYAPGGPMHDVNYNPEIFYHFGFNSDHGYRALDLGLFEHESNGEGGQKLDMRAWNRSYLRWHQETQASVTHTRFIGEFKLWYPYWFDNATPPDRFLCYRGLYEGIATVSNLSRGFFQIQDVTFRLYPGGKSHVDPTKGGQELTFSFKLDHQRLRFPFVIQIFHGYGEDLLDYSYEHFMVRGGVGF